MCVCCSYTVIGCACVPGAIGSLRYRVLVQHTCCEYIIYYINPMVVTHYLLSKDVTVSTCYPTKSWMRDDEKDKVTTSECVFLLISHLWTVIQLCQAEMMMITPSVMHTSHLWPLVQLCQADYHCNCCDWYILLSGAIRSVVGRNGYEYLRKMNYPLPSYRTLCRQIQNSSFTPGIQHDVLQWLRLKMSNAQESQKMCVLLIDEMQLKCRIQFDRGLRHIVGYVTPDNYYWNRTLTLRHSDINMNSLVHFVSSLSAQLAFHQCSFVYLREYKWQ